MDGFVISAIVSELNSWFCPGRIKRVLQTDKDTFWFYIIGNREGWVTISVKPPMPGIYATSRSPSRTKIKTSLGIALDRNLSGGEIIGIRAEDLERSIQIDIVPLRGGHTVAGLSLAIELTGHRPLLVLMESEGKRILASSMQYKGKNRSVVPGEAYEPLSDNYRYNPLKITAENWREVFLARPGDEGLKEFLIRHIKGISPIIAEEIIARAAVPENDKDKEGLCYKIWDVLQEVLAFYRAPSPYPVVISYPGSSTPPALFCFLPISGMSGGKMDTFSSMNEAADAFLRMYEDIYACRRIREELTVSINREMLRLNKRLGHLNRELEVYGDAEKEKEYGDILMAHLALLSKGMSEATLPDLYHGDKDIKIPLDPSKGPVENAQSYFKRYGKAKRGLAQVEARIEDTVASVELLNDLSQRIEAAKEARTLEGIRDSMPKRIKGKASGPVPLQVKKQKEKQFPGIRRFMLAEGWDVWVGKTDRANDYLTRRIALPEDIWLHVHGAPGSHCLLRNPRRLEDIPFDILKKAAGIAAFFSSQKKESKTLVGYTRAKYVRKPKGMKPGQVLAEREKTLLVNPALEVIPHDN